MPDAPTSGSGRSRKTFILDTNVLLFDPNALNVFEDNDLVIPITVIEEIDRFKKDLNETGRNARTVSRQLDALRQSGSLASGVPLSGGGTLTVRMPSDSTTLPEGFGRNSNDNDILRTVIEQAGAPDANPVVFVTRDTNMRIKADALGIRAEDYEHFHIEVDEMYTGLEELQQSAERISRLYTNGWLELPRGLKPVPNQFFILRNPANENHTALARFDPFEDRFKLINRRKDPVWGVFARNKEQLFALDLLLDERILSLIHI